ncbi:Zn-dependent oligopeptidase [Myxococcota bacterium]|nr:Zn-dependent oligopeptidase [Myxococcota bacterium]
MRALPRFPGFARLTAAAILSLTTACASTPKAPDVDPAVKAAEEAAAAEAKKVADAKAEEAKKAAEAAAEAAKTEWADVATVNARCAARRAKVTALREAIKAAPVKDEANVLTKQNQLMIELDTGISIVGLISNTSPDKAIREAGEKCEQDLRQLATEISLDRGLYDALAAVAVKTLDAEAKRFVEKVIRDFKRSGVDKDDATRARLKALQDELVKVGQDFARNIREDVRTIEVDPKELDGLPEDFVASKKPNDKGKLVLTTNYPDFFPVQTYAKNEDVRKRLLVESFNRASAKNPEVLKKLLSLRAEYAKLLGFPSWAQYMAEDKMVKSAAGIEKLIGDLAKLARPRMEKDKKELLARKKKDDKKAKAIEAWDRFYYVDRVRSEKYGVDSKEVRKYFDFTAVTKGIFDLYGELFGLRFVPTKNLPVWHESVLAYEVFQGDRKIGQFYLDLHPRDGKYNHAAMFPMVTGLAGGSEPVASLVCNFPDPSKSNGPALMEHGDVKTYFHEFGHLIHHLLARGSKWVNQSGISTEWDFVEAPSQLLEEWVWDANVLQRFAKDASGQPIPAALVEKMRKADEFGKGMHIMRQLALTATSFELHAKDPAKLDLNAFAADIAKRYSPYPYIPGTADYANFGHLEGYSSMYYTYQWSLVIAKDVFTRFAKSGLMDSKTAADYRDMILAPGGMKDASQLVKDFLGRDSSLDAYKAWLERD